MPREKWNTEDYPLNEIARIKLILKNAWNLAFDVAVRTMTIEEAQEEAWIKVAGSVKLMIEKGKED